MVRPWGCRVRHDWATNTSLQDLAIPQHTEVTAAPPSEAPPTRHCARVWVYPLVYAPQNSTGSAVSNPCASEGTEALVVKWCVQHLPIRGRTGFEPSFSFSLTSTNARTQPHTLSLLYIPIHALVRGNALFQQHKRQLYTWTSPDRWSILKSDWLYSLQSKMEKRYTVSKSKTMSWLVQIMNSVLKNSDLNWRKEGNSLGHYGMT